MLERHQPLGQKEQTILLVENEPANCNAVKCVLRREGVHFMEAGNSSGMLEIVTVASVNLILLDSGMPIIDGCGFLLRSRYHSNKEVFSIYIMTTWLDRLIGKNAVECVADNFVGKSVVCIERQACAKSGLYIGGHKQGLRNVHGYPESKLKQRTQHFQEVVTMLEEAWQETTLVDREP